MRQHKRCNGRDDPYSELATERRLCDLCQFQYLAQVAQHSTRLFNHSKPYISKHDRAITALHQ